MQTTFTVIGNIASGKSTLISLLSSSVNASVIDADNLFQTTDPFAKPFLADKKRWALANELWLTHERVKIMRKTKQQNQDKLTFIDSGLLMSWVYTHSHFLVGILTDDEWDLYTNLYEELTRGLLVDTSVIRLKYSMDTLMKRLNKRGRSFEMEFYTREYLGQIELGLDALEKRLKSENIKIITIDEATIADFENNPEETRQTLQMIKDATNQ